MDELVDAVNNLTTKNTKYDESNTATASDAQGDLKYNPETVTNTSNKNTTVTHTSNSNFEQKLLSNQTIPVLPPEMNPGIDQWIAPNYWRHRHSWRLRRRKSLRKRLWEARELTGLRCKLSGQGLME